MSNKGSSKDQPVLHDQAIVGTVTLKAMQSISGDVDLLMTAELVPKVKEEIRAELKRNLYRAADELTLNEIRFETLNIPLMQDIEAKP